MGIFDRVKDGLGMGGNDAALQQAETWLQQEYDDYDPDDFAWRRNEYDVPADRETPDDVASADIEVQLPDGINTYIMGALVEETGIGGIAPDEVGRNVDGLVAHYNGNPDYHGLNTMDLQFHGDGAGHAQGAYNPGSFPDRDWIRLGDDTAFDQETSMAYHRVKQIARYLSVMDQLDTHIADNEMQDETVSLSEIRNDQDMQEVASHYYSLHVPEDNMTLGELLHGQAVVEYEKEVTLENDDETDEPATPTTETVGYGTFTGRPDEYSPGQLLDAVDSRTPERLEADDEDATVEITAQQVGPNDVSMTQAVRRIDYGRGSLYVPDTETIEDVADRLFDVGDTMEFRRVSINTLDGTGTHDVFFANDRTAYDADFEIVEREAVEHAKRMKKDEAKQLLNDEGLL